MDEVDDAQPLALKVRTLSPRRCVVTWRGRGAASDAERDELARLAASRHAGATLLCAASDDRPLPAALDELTGGAPPVELDLESTRVALHAPRGRGRLLHFAAAAAARLEELIAGLAASTTAATAASDLERSIDEALARAAASRESRDGDLARSIGRDGKRRTTSERAGHLHPALLEPARANHAAAFRHEAQGGERFVARGVTGELRVGRLVRGRESFELRARVDGAPLRGFQLVVARLTAPEDRGALLRVDLDDLDLGPWRLGDRRDSSKWSRDEFRIASDLMAGRESFQLAFTVAGDAPIGSFHWDFHAEPEPDGVWLTELEPASAQRARPDEWCTAALESGEYARGFSMRAGETVEYELPRGYARLAAAVMTEPFGPNDSPKRPAPASVVVVLDGKQAQRVDVGSLAPGGRREFEVALDGARRLELAFEARAPAPTVLVVGPTLLRRA